MSAYFYWPYELPFRNPARGSVRGVLLRGGAGFSCLQPWEAFGDASLEDCLKVLAADVGMPGSSAFACLRCSLNALHLDATWRVQKLSAFHNLPVVENHLTLLDLPRMSCLEAAWDQGFRVAKLKMGQDLPTKTKDWLNLLKATSLDWRWRLDFNASLTPAELRRWLEALPSRVLPQIDFLEDPCTETGLGAEICREFKVPFANDWGTAASECDVRVVKPARDEDLVSVYPIVVTSYLDHPVGQCVAAAFCARMKANGGNLSRWQGLQTHGLFEPNDFSERLAMAGPGWQSPGGTGLGFDDLLERLPWRRLK